MAKEKLTKAEVAKIKSEKAAEKKAKKKKEKKHVVADFFRSFKSELKNVTWYSRSATIKDSVFVAVVLVLLATVVGLVDAGLNGLMTLLGNIL